MPLTNIILFITTLVATVFSFTAQAACNNVVQDKVINLNHSTIAIQRNLLVGGEVTSQSFNEGGTKFADYCDGNYAITSVISKQVSQGQIYESGVKGIGFSVTINDQLVSGNSRFTEAGDGKSAVMSPKIVVRLVKTDIVSPALLDTELFHLNLTDDSGTTYKVASYRLSANLLQTGCMFKNSPNIVVRMPDVSSAEFSGIGSSLNKTADASIPLNCSADTDINIKFSAVNTDDSKTIAVSPDSVAKGLGIRLNMNGNDVELNQDIFAFKTTIEGDTVIPLKARYVQTKENITGGDLKATATFTISYP